MESRPSSLAGGNPNPPARQSGGPSPARLTQANIDRLRRRKGIPVRSRQQAHNEVPSHESMRHFALGYGDDNPLWCDAPYAESSPWQGPIAPPMYPMSAGTAVPVSWTAAQAEAMSGGDPLAGMGQYMCGERWVFCAPVRPGRPLRRLQCLDGAELKSSSFAGGTGALVSQRTEFSSDDMPSPLSVRFVDFWHAEREASASSGKYRDIQPHVYTDAEMAALDELYEHEEVRGSDPRFWEDVSEDDRLGPIAKGPITLTDIITYHMAIGWGGYGGGTSKVAFKNRKRIPKFYTSNPLGIPDSAQRCHWDDDWAQRLGHPRAYDYGAIRTNWMVHLVTNWAGDAGWLWKLSASIHKFNYLGDAHRVSGTVVAKRQTDRTAEVDIAVEGANQRGEITCRALATVLLPTRDRPTVDIPSAADTEPPPAVAPGQATRPS